MIVELTYEENQIVVSCLSASIDFNNDFHMATRARFSAMKNAINERETFLIPVLEGESQLIRGAICKQMHHDNKILQKNFKRVFDKFVRY